jgi:hypothetical protein
MHGAKRNLQKQKDNDYRKSDWCEAQNIKLCIIKPNDIISKEFILDLIQEGDSNGIGQGNCGE